MAYKRDIENIENKDVDSGYRDWFIHGRQEQIKELEQKLFTRDGEKTESKNSNRRG